MNFQRLYWDEQEKIILVNNLTRIVTEGLRLIIPPKAQHIWEWAEQNIELDDTSAIPGMFKLINSPHLKGLFKAFEDPRVRKITVKGSVQIGKTLFMLICWAYDICNAPCPVMMMQPTRNDATTFIKTKLDPFIDGNEIIRRKVRSKKKKGVEDSADSTNNLKMYNGGWTEVINAGSKGATRGRSVKKTYGDDISVIQTDVSSEGDPAKNLENRTKAFKYNHKHINISQPALKDSCSISSRYEQGNQCDYTVNCLQCGAEQVLDDDKIVWEKDLDAFGKTIKNYPETAKIPCVKCGYLFTEKERILMLQKAMDREDCGHKPRYPEMITHFSTHIGQVSSTLSSLQRIAEERIEMEKTDNDDMRQSYWNTVKGEPYERQITKETDPLKIIDRNRSDYIKLDDIKIPNKVLLITCAIDVQKGSLEKPSRIEYEFWGWGKGEEAWILDKGKIEGNITDLNDVWQNYLNYYNTKKFIRHDGIELKISRVFIDTGYESTTVYQFVQNKIHNGFYAIKGANTYNAPVLPRTATYAYNDTVLLLSIGTQIIKHTIYNRLNDIVDKGDKFFHFATALCNHEYFEQLTAEKMIVMRVGLMEYYKYEKKKKGIANEALDLLVYNFAAMRHCLPNFEAMEESINKIKEETSIQKPVSSIQKPETSIQNPVSSIQNVRRKQTGYSVDSW